MVYKTENCNSLIVNCSCRCGDGLEFTISNFNNVAEVWMTQTTYSWNTENTTFWNRFKLKLKRLWSVLCNREYYYTEIILSKDDFSTFVEYVNEMHDNIIDIDNDNKTNTYLSITNNNNDFTAEENNNDIVNGV